VWCVPVNITRIKFAVMFHVEHVGGPIREDPPGTTPEVWKRGAGGRLTQAKRASSVRRRVPKKFEKSGNKNLRRRSR
jgi:hypothetical protein